MQLNAARKKMQQNDDPHAHQPVLRAGPELFDARLVTSFFTVVAPRRKTSLSSRESSRQQM
jgi:hypothetical protein